LRGITFTDTYFVLPSAERDESVHFHEMIHTAQWIALGWEAFVKVYGFHQMGYADDDVSQLKGYFENPLERQALCHQRHFDLGIPNPYLADQAVKAEIPRMLNFAP
jgi:hypothetical protein